MNYELILLESMNYQISHELVVVNPDTHALIAGECSKFHELMGEAEVERSPFRGSDKTLVGGKMQCDLKTSIETSPIYTSNSFAALELMDTGDGDVPEADGSLSARVSPLGSPRVLPLCRRKSMDMIGDVHESIQQLKANHATLE